MNTSLLILSLLLSLSNIYSLSSLSPSVRRAHTGLSLSLSLSFHLLDLSLSLGKSRMLIHSMDEKMLSLSLFSSSENENEREIFPAVFVTCSDYDQATSVQDYFTELLEERNYHPLFVSLAENSVCFVVNVESSSTLELLRSQQILRSFTGQ